MHRPYRYAIPLLILGFVLVGLVGTGLRRSWMAGPGATKGWRSPPSSPELARHPATEGEVLPFPHGNSRDEPGGNPPGGTQGSPTGVPPPALTAGWRANPSDDRAVVDGFSRWLDAARESGWTLNRDAGFVEEGVERARARRGVLRRWIENDPRAALAASIPWEVRRNVPEAVRMELEEVVSAKGDLEVLCVWRPPNRAGTGAPYIRTFTVEGRVFRAFVYGRREVQTTAGGVVLNGIAVDDLLAVAESPLRLLEPGEAEEEIRRGRVEGGAVCGVTGGAATVVARHGDALLPLADAGVAADLGRRLASVEPGFRTSQEPPSFREWTHGVKRLLFMRARFPDDLREPISEAEAAEVMQLANEYFVGTSFNNLAVISTIGPLVMLPQPKLYYSARGPGALMADARVATREAGFEPDVYDLDMVRFENVPGFEWGGLGSVGGKGVWLQGSGLGVICHELGHNLGLSHANFWNTVRPELPDNPQNLPFDPDSLVGIDSVMGPGDDVEYGDPFDVMGSGGGASAHFTGLHKYLLGWVPEASVLTVTTSGTYRIHAHDAGVLAAGATHILRVRKDTERLYWIDARSGPADNPWQSRGVELHWNNWHQSIASCQLLDTTPGSRHGKDDAGLTLGRMFSDEAAGVHITTLARGVGSLGGVDVPFYDVSVRVGGSAGNRPPELTLELSATTAGVNQPVELKALATDADGDELAYAWDLGEGIPGENRAVLSRAWSQPGDYVVRCEVSDRRGGRAARHAVVRVGGTSGVGGLRIQGRVLDQSGRPLLGVRVHNGQAGTNSPYAPEYRWAYTDSDGRYTMVGMQPGSFEVGAVLAGYEVRPLNFNRPLILNQFTGVDVDFIAAARPLVNVLPVADGDESAERAAQVRIMRSGPTNETLRVYFRTAGTAAAGEDYEPWSQVEVQTNVIPTVLQPVTQTLELGYVDLGPGLLSADVAFPVLRDSTPEGEESVVVTLVYPVSRTEITETETNTFDIPGWEVLADNGRDTWFQTRPRYQLGPLDEAAVRILEGGVAPPTTLAILALERVTSENPGDSATFLVTRTGRRPDGPIAVPLSVSGTATSGDDYQALPALLRIPADAEAVRVTVDVLDDRFVEGNETVTVGLGDGAGYTVAGRTATVTIVDNDLPWVTVTVVDPVVAEDGGAARVAFQRSGDLGGALEVDYLLGGTAVAGVDYASLPGRVVIPAGEEAASVLVTALDDAAWEGDETVIARVGDSPVYNVVQPGFGTVTVRDNEFPTVTVEVVDEEAVEGNDDPGTWLIRRTGSTAEPLEVRYRFGGSAQHQVDFIAIGDRVTVPAGQAVVVLTAMPIDDAFREDPETIAIELLEGPGYAVGTPARAAVQLLDNDDSELGVGFALLASRGPESKTDPELVVRISGNPDEGPENAVTVAWELLGGTAMSGEDFVLTNGTLVFGYSDPDGETPWTNRVGTIPLQVLDDLLPESDESVLIRLRIAPTEVASEDPEAPPTVVTNGRLDVFTVHTYTIGDDDASEITVAAVRSATVEGGAEPGLFAIRRTGRTNTAQEVTFDLSGLASAGSDYLDGARSVTIPAGRTEMEVAILPIDDPVEEYRENVRLTLLGAPGARFGGARFADVEIDDNDGTIEFALARWDASEGDGVARILVRRSGDTNLAATVNFDVGGGTATPASAEIGTGADYWATNGVLHFVPGDRVKEFNVALVDDLEIEEPETIRLALSRGTGLFPLGGQNTATLTILDNDGLISTGTNITAAIESEFEVVVTLERTGPVENALEVDFQTRDLNAAEGLDYVASSGSLAFEAGERSVELRVGLRDDELIEGDELFLIDLFASGGEPLGEVVVTIVDDDCALEFASGAVEVDEDGGVVELTVVRVGSPLNPVMVNYETISGTARESEDFVRTAGMLRFLGNRFETLTNGTGEVVFLAGETNHVITVPILNDAEGERDEVFAVILSDARPGFPSDGDPFVRLGTLTNAIVTLRDNEAPGRVDDQFQPGLGADAPVRALGLQADGKVLVGGDFGTFDGVLLPRLARLHADGFVDQSFNPGRGFDGNVLAVSEIAEGRILVGGTFSRVDGADRPFLARLEPDGTRSATGQTLVDGPVRAIVAGDGVYIGGAFSRVDGLARSGIARLGEDGAVDGGFDARGTGRPDVRVLLRTDDGGVWVGGAFENWAGTGLRHLVRLGTDGVADRTVPAAFLPNGPVNALAWGTDGTLYVAGTFTMVGGLPRAGVARLLPGGGVDAGFDPGEAANDAVLAAGGQGSGRVLLGGAFDAFGGLMTGRFVRVEGDGSVDAAFFRGTGANGTVRALVVQPNGAILLGGDFTEVNGRPRRRVARIHADEKFAEGFVEFAESVVTVSETVGEVMIQVRRTGSAKGEVRVGYRTRDITAEAGLDYDGVTGELTFAEGQTQGTFRIGIRNDALAEGSEGVSLALFDPEGAEIGRQGTSVLVIVDDEAAIAWDLVGMEVAENAGTARMTLRRSGPATGEARVRARTQAGSAVEGEDYGGLSQEVVFGPGVSEVEMAIGIVNDEQVEGLEGFQVVLSDPMGGVELGSQSELDVTIVDDDRLPTQYTLTIQPAPGGLVIPGGGRFPTNAVVTLNAVPAHGFEFARWEGTAVSADNPFALTMDRNHVLTARFRARDYLETFESGGLEALPWRTVGEGNAPWVATRDSASTGEWSARSGPVTNGGLSVLRLERETPAGGGSFDFRTETEAGWDFLEFWLNGERLERWSGVNGWQTYAFNVPAGRNQMEWRYARDRSFGGTLDAVWIDNLDLPETGPSVERPRLRWVGGLESCAIEVQGEGGRVHTLESSVDLLVWTAVASGVSGEGGMVLKDPACGSGAARYYRVRVD